MVQKENGMKLSIPMKERLIGKAKNQYELSMKEAKENYGGIISLLLQDTATKKYNERVAQISGIQTRI